MFQLNQDQLLSLVIGLPWHRCGQEYTALQKLILVGDGNMFFLLICVFSCVFLFPCFINKMWNWRVFNHYEPEVCFDNFALLQLIYCDKVHFFSLLVINRKQKNLNKDTKVNQNPQGWRVGIKKLKYELYSIKPGLYTPQQYTTPKIRQNWYSKLSFCLFISWHNFMVFLKNSSCSLDFFKGNKVVVKYLYKTFLRKYYWTTPVMALSKSIFVFSTGNAWKLWLCIQAEIWLILVIWKCYFT